MRPMSLLEYQFLLSLGANVTFATDATLNCALNFFNGNYDGLDDNVVLLSSQPTDLLKVLANSSLPMSDIAPVFMGIFLPRFVIFVLH